MQLTKNSGLEQSSKPVVLAVGLEGIVEQVVRPLLARFDRWDLKPSEIDRLIDTSPERAPSLILCGSELQSLNPLEMAQFLRALFQEASILLISKNRLAYERSHYIKHGFTDAFMATVDSEQLKRAIENALSQQGLMKVYRPVRMMDIEPRTTLPVDVSLFLPANRKYIKYCSAGDPLGEDRAERLRAKQVRSLYVSADQLPLFYRFAAEQLKGLQSNREISETERQERLRAAIRSLMGGLLDGTESEGTFSQGRALVAGCREVVSNFLHQGASASLYQQILDSMEDSNDVYSHGRNVSTFAALFSMGLKIGKPEDLAMAGLLHDIGLGLVPLDVQFKGDHEKSDNDAKILRKHVDHTIQLIKERKLILSDSVTKAIYQHHERWDGKGYPRGLTGDRISPEAQVLAIADRFDELMTEGRKAGRMDPGKAFRSILEECGQSAGAQCLNPALVQKVRDLMGEREC